MSNYYTESLDATRKAAQDSARAAIINRPYVDSLRTAALAAQAAADAAAADAASASSSAAESLSAALNAANLVGAPADTAIATAVGSTVSETRGALDTYLGGSASGLVGQVNARARLVAPTGTAAANVTTLQSAVDAAAAAGAPLVVRGSFSVAGTVAVPSGSDIDFSQAMVTQTSNLTPILTLTNVTGITLRSPRMQGKTSDYTNGNGVYAAAAIRVLGTTSDVEIVGGRLLGFAGAGVYLAAATSGVKIRNVRMTGAGSAYILNTTYNFSGGIVTETGATKWQAIGNEISGFAQGIVTGDNMQDVIVTGNYIHDIPGQHGIYMETVNGAVISGNLVRSCALLGMKIQVGATTVLDADAVTISDNVFTQLGAQGILLTNPPGGTPRLRRVSVTGNVVRTAAGNGIEANNCVGLHISDNLLYDVAAGIQVGSSQGVEVFDNRINVTKQNGITLTDVTDAVVDTNRIIDPASTDNASAEFGIQIAGATSADITLRNNKITDSLTHMRYGIYVSAGDQTSVDFIGNRVTGATDYGMRGVAATACREWRDNDLQGTLGRHLNAPTSGGGRFAPHAYGTAAPTTGAHIVGEVVWNSAPAASGTIGWVCTTAGTPGTWKTFGAISA